MEWRFKALTRNDTLQNAAHLEFFHNEALNSPVDALVREDIQNRLDARARNEPFVEVRYRICGPTSAQSRRSWFDGLPKHLGSPQVKEELGYSPSIDHPLSWLVVEDFRTTGLEGDPSTYQDPDPQHGVPRNDFFWFVRNVGRSGKKGGERGRWGLGKIVYPASSRIRSFFAYTVRQSDQRGLLIGRSVLAVHFLNGHQHDSEGYFGRFDDVLAGRILFRIDLSATGERNTQHRGRHCGLTKAEKCPLEGEGFTGGVAGCSARSREREVVQQHRFWN